MTVRPEEGLWRTAVRLEATEKFSREDGNSAGTLEDSISAAGALEDSASGVGALGLAVDYDAGTLDGGR